MNAAVVNAAAVCCSCRRGRQAGLGPAHRRHRDPRQGRHCLRRGQDPVRRAAPRPSTTRPASGPIRRCRPPRPAPPSAGPPSSPWLSSCSASCRARADRHHWPAARPAGRPSAVHTQPARNSKLREAARHEAPLPAGRRSIHGLRAFWMQTDAQLRGIMWPARGARHAALHELVRLPGDAFQNPAKLE